MPPDQMLILRLVRPSQHFGQDNVRMVTRDRNLRVLVEEEYVLDEHQAALDWGNHDVLSP